MNNGIYHISDVATKEGLYAKEAITTLGCMMYEQLQYFLPEPNYMTAQKKANVVLRYLSKIRVATQDGDMICAPSSLPDKKLCDSIWLMINLLKPSSDADEPLYESVRNAFLLGKPESLCFIKDNTNVIRTIVISNEAEVSLLSIVQDKIYSGFNIEKGEESTLNSTLYIIIKDQMLIKNIGDLGLTIPHKIALMIGEGKTMPTFKYFGNTN